jgi:hypothetical protein
MSTRVVIGLVICLLSGSMLGYTLNSNLSESNIALLQGELSSTQQVLDEDQRTIIDMTNKLHALSGEKMELQSSYSSLSSNYSMLKSSFSSLQTQYEILSNDSDSGYVQLSSKYIDLLNRYDALSKMLSDKIYGTPNSDTMLRYYYQLNEKVRLLNNSLWSKCNLESSFGNTLSLGEVTQMKDAVKSIVGSSTDHWSNYQGIYQYVSSNIIYVYDVEMPYITYYRYVDVNGIRYLTGFNYSAIDNYVQKPSWTLENKQGDCDDQATLEYAMLRYYNKYYIGTDYNLYIADIDFNDDSGHVAVFMPVQGGKLIILDPAGHYLTSTRSIIDSKPAASELNSYNANWSKDGHIKNIKLYWVDLETGGHAVVSEGTLSEIADYLSQS